MPVALLVPILLVSALGSFGAASTLALAPTVAAVETAYEYRLLATTKTSTLEKELNEAAGEGFRLANVMGGNTAHGGDEVVATVVRSPDTPHERRYEYKLQATQRTSTMQKELNEVGAEGFRYRGQTVFDSLWGGNEVAVIVELDLFSEPVPHEYLLLATNRTSTMEKELSEAGAEGFELLGMTVGDTAFGGDEIVCILQRPRPE